jgi:hypothetical protein
VAYTLRRVCFAAPWLVVLGWILWQGIENIEGALILFLVAGMELAAAPTSFVVAVAIPDRMNPDVRSILLAMVPSDPQGLPSAQATPAATQSGIFGVAVDFQRSFALN